MIDNQQLSNLTIFKGLKKSQIDQLKHLMDFCSFNADMVIFEQGASADYLYILIKGEVAIRYKPYDGPPLIISRIFPGNVFGWSSALNREIYSSSSYTVVDSEVIRIKGVNLHNLCDSYPVTGAIFLDRLAGVISERIKNSHHEILALLSNGMDTQSECRRRIFGNGK